MPQQSARATNIIFMILLTVCNAKCFAQAAPSAPTTLSLQQAVQIALHTYPSALQAKALARAARANVSAVSSPANPTLSLARHAGSNTGGLDEDVLLTQTWPLGDLRRQTIHAARFQSYAAQDAYTASRNALALQVETAYYQVLQSQADVRLAQKALSDAEAFASAAGTGFQAGSVARSNVLRSEVALSQAQQALSDAETVENNRTDALHILLGMPLNKKLTLTNVLAYTPVTMQLPALENLAMHARPDLQEAVQMQNAADANLHLARIQNQPNLFVEIRHTPMFRSGGSSIRVGVVFPIIDYGGQRAGEHAAEQNLKAQQFNVQTLQRTIDLQVTTAYNNLQNAQNAVHTFQNGRLQRAKQLLQMVQLGYSKGANTYLELLDAEQAYQTEQTGYISALTSYNVARMELIRAVGGKLP